MGTSIVPVDLFNPGQVFACVGLAEVAESLWSQATGSFDWTQPQVVFRLAVKDEISPIGGILGFLGSASVVAVTPHDPARSPAVWNNKVKAEISKKSKGKSPRLSREQLEMRLAEEWNNWKKTLSDIPLVAHSPKGSYPIPFPSSAATVPIELHSGSKRVKLSHWGDSRVHSGLDNIKFWAGSGGYPGAKLIQDALDTLPDDIQALSDDPFNFSAEQSSSCRFDWRRDYIPLDIGFSLNTHDKNRFAPMGYPLVEILATIGVSYARPSRVDPTNKLSYRYGVIGQTGSTLYPLQLLRASLGGQNEFPFPLRYFQMNLGWPGKEGQARCITTVTEESTL